MNGYDDYDDRSDQSDEGLQNTLNSPLKGWGQWIFGMSLLALVLVFGLTNWQNTNQFITSQKEADRRHTDALNNLQKDMEETARKREESLVNEQKDREKKLVEVQEDHEKKLAKIYEERIAWRDEVIKKNEQNLELWRANSENWKKQSQLWEENWKDALKLHDDLAKQQDRRLKRAMEVIEELEAKNDRQEADIKIRENESMKRFLKDLAETLVTALEDPKKMRDWVIDELWRVRISQFHRQEWMPPAQ